MNKDIVLSKIKETFLNDIRNLDIFQYIEEEDVGYFGRISSTEFITYDRLNELLGLKNNIPTDDMDWLCFWYKGDLLFISQHPITVEETWDRLNELKLVDGSTVIEINNDEYSVMLPTGGNVDSINDNSGIPNMWDDLIVRVHVDNKTWHNLTDEELSVNYHKSVIGAATMCQEKHIENNNLMILRGYYTVKSIDFNSVINIGNTHEGTRIVLKLNLNKLNKDKNTVNVTNIVYNESKHTHCKICGDIGSYYDDNDKLVKCCDPKSKEVKYSTIVDVDKSLVDKKLKYDKYMMDTASIWKQLSVCKRNQVGCVIGTDDGRILVNGYNGTVTGIANDCEVICDLCHGTKKQDNDQPFDDMYNCCRKCGGSGIITTKFVVHAEQNAITFAAKEGIKLKGTTLYTTTSPCPDCAKLIASSGIKRVLYLDEYKDTSGVDFLNHCGVSCYKI